MSKYIKGGQERRKESSRGIGERDERTEGTKRTYRTEKTERKWRTEGPERTEKI